MTATLNSDIYVKVKRGGGQGLRIGELARVSGASPRSLRHYEAAGLIRSVRGPNGYRDFDPDQVDRVRAVRELLEAGLTLTAITDVLPCYDGNGIPRQCSAADARARLALADLDRRAERIAAARRRLSSLLER